VAVEGAGHRPAVDVLEEVVDEDVDREVGDGAGFGGRDVGGVTDREDVVVLLRVEFTTSPALIATGIDQVFPRPASGATLLEAVMESIRDLRTRSAARAAIVAFVAEQGPEFSPQRHTQVADALKTNRVSLWSLVLQSRTGQDMSEAGRERSMVLADVSRQSGGFSKVVLSKQGIAPGFEALAAALTSRYEVAYGRPESLIPPSRLNVEVRDPTLQVIATSWAAE
jgi:hypothetical protein